MPGFESPTVQSGTQIPARIRIILNSFWELNFEDGRVNLNGLCLIVGCSVDWIAFGCTTACIEDRANQG